MFFISLFISFSNLVISVLAFLFLSFFQAQAQTLEFQSSINEPEIALNESLILNLEFQSNSKLSKTLNIDIPDIFNLKNFTFLNESQSHKSSLSIINGKRKFVQSIIKSYYLQPKALGVFTIQPMKVTAGQQTFHTPSYKIKVSADKKPRAPQNPFSFPGFSGPFPPSILDFPNPFNKDFFNQPQGNFKFLLDLRKKKLYKSEALKADWLLLFTSKMPRYELAPIPPPKGFWKEEIKNIKPITGSKAIGDTLYRKQPVSRLWLFPLKTGELKIPSHSVHIFSGFSFQGQKLSSPERSVQVMDIPIQGRDLSFTGAVGSFQVDFSIPKKDLNLNEPFSFKITFKGSGHPRFIQLPYLNFGSNFQAYDPIQKSNFSPEGVGTKEFEFLIVPKKEDSLTFPSITLSSFDPKKEKYVYHKSPDFKLFIKKDSNSNPSQPSQAFFDAPVKKENLSQSHFSKLIWPSFLNYKTMLFSFYVCFFFFFFIFLFRIRKKVFLNKSQSLNKKINNKIKNIEQKLNQITWQKACIEMIHLLKFILDAFQTENSSSHWRQALDNLPPSLNKKYAKELNSLFKDLEQLSFSSQRNENQALQTAKTLLKKIKNLRKKLSSHL